MTKLIIDLQKKLFDKNVSTTDLLRLMLLISSKLQLIDIESWILKELDGYDQKEEVPEYRQVQGVIKVKTPYQGWQPISFENHKLGEALSKRGCGQPISELESLIQSSQETATLQLHYPLDIAQQIMQAVNPRFPMQPALFISSAQIEKIIQTVRNNILKWSLELEKAGILGENMEFTFEEKKQGSNVEISAPPQYNGHHITVIYGGMANSQIQQGNTASTQNFTKSSLDLQKVQDLICEIREKIESLQLNKNQLQEVEANLATLEAQKNSPKPHFYIINATLQSLRSILEGVASSAASAFILEKINQLLQ